MLGVDLLLCLLCQAVLLLLLLWLVLGLMMLTAPHQHYNSYLPLSKRALARMLNVRAEKVAPPAHTSVMVHQLFIAGGDEGLPAAELHIL